MSPRAISDVARHHPAALHVGDSVRHAVERLLEVDLPALPVVDEAERYVGIFGEREFLSALFPGYLAQLTGAAFVPRSLDDVLEKREASREETVGDHMNTEHVEVGEDVSDTEIAAIFFQHRVLIVPVLSGHHVQGVITRHDFFRTLGERFLDRPGS